MRVCVYVCVCTTNNFFIIISMVSHVFRIMASDVFSCLARSFSYFDILHILAVFGISKRFRSIQIVPHDGRASVANFIYHNLRPNSYRHIKSEWLSRKRAPAFSLVRKRRNYKIGGQIIHSFASLLS